ncbi:hypothetical protein NQ314_010776 [Rhamnusium bicolor]|uniref:Nuclear RNA export factor 1 n=1 Tax=Rhamnusium bicolor TaxID=1586634 RepID=A0AAV8XNR8_9CUCU|nr:hypothetical protein NQ314_010776 [Rhamnusium bicolor]
MPKSYFGNKQTTWVKDDRERDYRVSDRDRRVTFKPNRYGGNKEFNNRDWKNAIREHLQDEDVDMGVSSGSGRYHNKKFNRGKKGRRGSPVPNTKWKLLESPTGWYKVSWQVYGTTITFYVDDLKVAEKLQSLDKQIQLPSGFKIFVRVNAGSPNVDMNSTTKQKMKEVMAKRYNSITKALDLTKFHADPDLQGFFCALFKPIVFITVIEIIAENIPELEALNLFDNKIMMLSVFKKSLKKLPNLKILHMGNNKLRDISQLDSLQGLPIIDLVLDGNPLCDKFKEQTSYISEVRKRFPKCIKLDGIDLPPPICFDITEEHHLPDPQQTFLCNSEGGSIVRQFLEQYFLIYDTNNRQPLLQAYHENAIFSMTMAYPYGCKDKAAAWLHWYHTDNRNLKRVLDTERRVKLLKQGQLAVVSYLQEMPLTKHDIHSFTVDLTLFTPQMLCLTVSGMFRELKSGNKSPPIRYFFRTLVIVPAGSGFCIANEELHITNAFPDQAKEAFKTPVAVEPTPVAPVATVSSPGGPAVSPIVPVPDDATKQEMVRQMSAQSGMNLEWSLKCLEETQWDFQRASLVFQHLQSQGVIPPEAFVK